VSPLMEPSVKNKHQLNYTSLKVLLNKQEFVRPRWPYDMRPSVRAEKYMCVIVICYVARRDAR